MCRQYTPQPLGTVVTVPILQALQQCHDSPVPGHQGFNKTLELLRKEAYWVNMISDVESYCQQCQKCQQFKLPLPSRAPLTSIPIGKPWKMVFLCQPMVTNVYLSCKTTSQKRGGPIPLPNQKAITITKVLVNLFTTMGIPQIVHSDQGENFESAVLRQTLDAFGIKVTHNSLSSTRRWPC